MRLCTSTLRFLVELIRAQTERGLVATGNLIGMAVGAIVWGTIADRFGRKRAFAWTLLIFAVVNAALIKMHWRGDPALAGSFRCPRWAPVMGLLTTATLLVADAFQ